MHWLGWPTCMTRISSTVVRTTPNLHHLTHPTNQDFSSDIKPNNIFVDFDETPDGVIKVKAVQLGDLEMGCAIPPDLNVRGARLGNPMWRSPEAHAAGRMNLPSDVFSFGLVVSIAVPFYSLASRLTKVLGKVHIHHASAHHSPSRRRKGGRIIRGRERTHDCEAPALPLWG